MRGRVTGTNAVVGVFDGLFGVHRRVDGVGYIGKIEGVDTENLKIVALHYVSLFVRPDDAR